MTNEPAIRLSDQNRIVTHLADVGGFSTQGRFAWFPFACVLTVFLTIVMNIKAFNHLYKQWDILLSALSTSWILPLFTLIFLLIGLKIYTHRRLSILEIKLLLINEKGIGIGRQGLRLIDGGFSVNWGNIESIESRELSSGKWLDIRTNRGLTYRIRWKNAFDWIEVDNFVRAVRTHAPRIPISIKSDYGTTKEITFTDIWLECYSPSEVRSRKGLLPPGTLLRDGRYEIIKLIGGGGQGNAYLASVNAETVNDSSPENREKVVLKEFILPVHQDASLIENQTSVLNREASILSKIRHTNVVNLLDHFVEDFRSYLVIEFIEGLSLRKLVCEKGKLNYKEAIGIVIETCEILHYLHNMTPPVIHQDISPDNLIFTPEREVKLIDFTVARYHDPEIVCTVVGKQSYLAPEQLKGLLSPKSDLYSLGATLFYLLTGEDPEPLSVAAPSTTVLDIPEKLDNILLAVTHPDPTRRVASAVEFSSMLLDFLVK